LADEVCDGHNLSVGDAQFEYLVVNRFSGLDGSNRLLQIDIIRPKLERLEEASLSGKGLSKGEVISAPILYYWHSMDLT
jgi:hypothetical protein